MNNNNRNIVSMVLLSNNRLGYSLRTRSNPERDGVTFDAYGHYSGLKPLRPINGEAEKHALMDAVGAPLAMAILDTLKNLDLTKYKN